MGCIYFSLSIFLICILFFLIHFFCTYFLSRRRVIGVDFFVLTSSALFQWFGDAEKLTKALFSFASRLAPVIIFVDEVGRRLPLFTAVPCSFWRSLALTFVIWAALT